MSDIIDISDSKDDTGLPLPKGYSRRLSVGDRDTKSDTNDDDDNEYGVIDGAN